MPGGLFLTAIMSSTRARSRGTAGVPVVVVATRGAGDELKAIGPGSCRVRIGHREPGELRRLGV